MVLWMKMAVVDLVSGIFQESYCSISMGGLSCSPQPETVEAYI